MGLPAYLLGLSIPVIGVVITMTVLMKLMGNQTRQLEYGGGPPRTQNPSRSWRTNDFNKKRERLISDSDCCSICQDRLGSSIYRRLPCDDAFHSKCINDLLHAGHDSCPNCRMKIH